MSTQTAAVRSTPVIPPGRWVIDRTHSSVAFAVKHMGIATVRGHFREFEGTIEVGDDFASSRAFGKVRVASIFTNDEQRDAHLRSADFFLTPSGFKVTNMRPAFAVPPPPPPPPVKAITSWTDGSSPTAAAKRLRSRRVAWDDVD